MSDLTGIGSIADFATTLATRLLPDKSQQAKDQAALDILKTTDEYNLQIGQIEINKIEAVNPNLFVSGWRPFAGWTCGFAFFYATLAEPMARFFAQVVFSYKGAFPPLDTVLTVQVLGLLLGVGALRTIEKVKGVA